MLNKFEIIRINKMAVNGAIITCEEEMAVKSLPQATETEIDKATEILLGAGMPDLSYVLWFALRPNYHSDDKIVLDIAYGEPEAPQIVSFYVGIDDEKINYLMTMCWLCNLPLWSVDKNKNESCFWTGCKYQLNGFKQWGN